MRTNCTCCAGGDREDCRRDGLGGDPRGGGRGGVFPAQCLSVVALWGLMNYLLQSSLLCYKSSLVPSALWAAEHRTGAAGVCVVVSDT